MPARYRELVVEAPRGWGRGFLEGWLQARAPETPVFDAEEEGFDPGGFGETVREMVHPTREVLHLLVPETAHPHLHEAVVEACGAGHRVEIRTEREIAGARFGFRVRIHAPEHAARVRSLLTDLSPGLVLDPGTRFEERRNPDADGLEAYAPEYAYTLEGRGAVSGPLPEIVRHLRICREEELVHVEGPELLAGP